MAIQTQNFNNGDYVLGGSKRVITCTSSQVDQPKFRFYLEVVYDGKTYAYTFRPNQLEYGIIDISSIIQNLVYSINVQQVLTLPDALSAGNSNKFQQNIHSMPHKKFIGTGYRQQYLSTGGNGAKRIQLKLYDFYATTSNTAPAKQGSSVDANMYVLAGYNKSTDLINYSFSDYSLTASSKQWLNGNYNSLNATTQSIDTAISDYGTLAFLNRTDDVNDSANTEYITIKYYNTSGTETTQVFANSNLYGGKYASAGVTDDSMIIHFSCYPANLNKLEATFTRPSDISNLDYYEVYASSSNGSSQYSKKYRFNIIERCDKYDAQRFAYINNFGVWEYITFNKKRTDRISNTKTEIKSSVYNYQLEYDNVSAGYNEQPFVPGVAHESRRVTSTNAKQSFTINTGYLQDYEIEQVKDMFLSSSINYINTDGTALSVILTNRNIDEVVVSHNYEQTEYRLTFEYSIETYNPILL